MSFQRRGYNDARSIYNKIIPFAPLFLSEFVCIFWFFVPTIASRDPNEVICNEKSLPETGKEEL